MVFNKALLRLAFLSMSSLAKLLVSATDSEDRSPAVHGASSAPTGTRPGSVPVRRPAETPTIAARAAGARSPTPFGCGDSAGHPRRSAACRADGVVGG